MQAMAFQGWFLFHLPRRLSMKQFFSHHGANTCENHRGARGKDAGGAQRLWFGHEDKCSMCRCVISHQRDHTYVGRSPEPKEELQVQDQVTPGALSAPAGSCLFSRSLCVLAEFLSSVTQQGPTPYPGIADHLLLPATPILLQLIWPHHCHLYSLELSVWFQISLATNCRAMHSLCFSCKDFMLQIMSATTQWHRIPPA